MKLSKISIKKIITNPDQPRKTFDLDKIEELNTRKNKFNLNENYSFDVDKLNDV